MIDQLTKEEWRPIEGYPNYFISNFGNVRHGEKILKPGLNSHGYYRINLKKGDEYKTRFIHRLIALAFIPNPDPETKTHVNHINGIKTDNRLNNLEWVTPKENNNHAFRTGLYKRKMLSEEEDKIIKDLYSQGVSSKELAERFGVHINTIQKHVQGIWTQQNLVEIPRKINELYNSGLDAYEIAKRLSITPTTVYKYLHSNDKFLSDQENRKNKIEKVRKLYREGKTAREISEMFGMNINSIWSLGRGCRDII